MSLLRQVNILDAEDNLVDVQYPLSIDGDSVYAKDIDVANSSIGGFSGAVVDLFNDRMSTIVDSSATNPKSITIALKRPIFNKEVTLVTSSGSFKNTKLIFKNAAGTVLETVDESADSTAYTSRIFQLQNIDRWCIVTIEFHTTDTITLSFGFIYKAIRTHSRIFALNPSGEIIPVDATAGGNLKISVEEGDNAAAPVHVYLTDDTSGTKADIITNTDKDTNIDGTNGLVTSSALYGRINDTTVKMARIDQITHTLMTVDYVHHEMHDGSHFYYTDTLTLGSGATQDYMLTTPNTTTWPHLTFAVNSSLKITTEIYESGDRTGTTSQSTFDNNRNTANTATMVIHKGTSGGTTDGTKIWSCMSGSAAAAGKAGSTRLDNGELILKQNTKYILRITSGAANNDVCVDISWYEHANRS